MYDPGFLERKLQDSTTSNGDTDILLSRRDAIRAFKDSKESVRLLGQAFRNLKRSIGSHCLASLSLQVLVSFHNGECYEKPALHIHDPVVSIAPTCGVEFDLICEAAASTFRIIAGVKPPGDTEA